MKVAAFQNLSDEALINAFLEWAKIKGQGTLNGNMAAVRKASPRLEALGRVLRTRGPEVRSLLLPFLNHPHEGVRYHVAKHLLAIAPERARGVIESLAADVGPIAGAAGMTLYALDEGIFKPD